MKYIMNKLIGVLFILGLSLGDGIRNYMMEFDSWMTGHNIQIKSVEEKERMIKKNEARILKIVFTN